MIEKVNLSEKLSLFNEMYSPKIVGDINDVQVKLVKFKGEFVMHSHENEDEFFLVIKGKMIMKLQDKEIEINEGEFIIIPKGVEHCPDAEEEVHVMVIEPGTVLNTGNVRNDMTIESPDRI